MVGNLILYLVCTIAIVVFSLMAVTSKKILRSATYLLFTLLATAVLYFQLGYEFLGAVQIAVYAGGILVLFVFAILLTQRPDETTPQVSVKKQALAFTTALLGIAVLWYVFVTFPVTGSGLSLKDALASDNLTMERIGHALMGTGKFEYLLPFEAISVLLLACIIGSLAIARKR